MPPVGETYDQKIIRRCIDACGGRQSQLADRMLIPGARGVVSRIVDGTRGITRRVGLAMAVATQDTDDPVPISAIFPELFGELPTRKAWPAWLRQDDARRASQLKARKRMQRRRDKAALKGRLAANERAAA